MKLQTGYLAALGTVVLKIVDSWDLQQSEVTLTCMHELSCMLLAGLSIAMGNASEHVKSVSHETTLSNDEDGVAAAIKKYVLEPRGL